MLGRKRRRISLEAQGRHRTRPELENRLLQRGSDSEVSGDYTHPTQFGSKRRQAGSTRAGGRRRRRVGPSRPRGGVAVPTRVSSARGAHLRGAGRNPRASSALRASIACRYIPGTAPRGGAGAGRSTAGARGGCTGRAAGAGAAGKPEKGASGPKPDRGL